MLERLPDWCRREDSLIRSIAVNGVRRLNLTDATAEVTLRDLLNDPDPDVRVDTAYALGELKVASSAEDLVEIITHDPVGEARIQATKALGKIGVSRVIDPLVDCVHNDGYPELEVYADEAESNPCWEVQSEAIVALGEIASQSVVEPLINFINESDYDDLQDLGFRTLVKVDSVQAHSYIHQQLQNGEEKSKRRVIRALADANKNGVGVGRLSKELIVDLNRSLDDTDPEIRLNSARALAQFADPPASLALCRLLLDSDKAVRRAASEILGQSEGTETVELLHDMLKITDPELQQLVAGILGQIGSVESSHKMAEMLEIAEGDLRAELVKNIGLTGTADCAGVLMLVLQKEISEETKLLVLVAMGQVLSRTAETQDDQVIESVRDALYPFIFSLDRTLSTLALEAYVKSLDDPVEFLLRFVQIDEFAEEQPNIEAENLIPVTDVSEQVDASKDQVIEEDECLAVEEEHIPIDEFLTELPNAGNPADSTLASILSGSGSVESDSVDETDAESIDNQIVDWLPVQAARLLVEHANVDDQIIDSLLDITNTANDDVVCEIVEIIGRVKTPKTGAFLERCLREREGATLLAALHALKELALPIDDKEIVSELLKDDNPLIRQRCVALLALTDTQLLTEYLTSAFADDDREVCIAALELITKENLNEEMRTSLFDLLMKSGGSLTAPIGEVLRRVEDSEAVSWLLEKLLDEGLKEFHWIFINALTEVYDPEMAATAD